ncbi:MAG TPA: protein translocase subunit SecF, partial [Gammaproteobacteria bacterium]|nr:protein translocase subunit SecF [Gammaproteobacteria bacterium]
MTIDFMGKRYLAAIFSGLILAGSIAALALLGVNRGLDFTGGALIEVGFGESVEPTTVRNILSDAGYTNAVVQKFGSQTDILIRVPPNSVAAGTGSQTILGDQISAALGARIGKVELRRSEFVGPAVGEELTEDAGLALLAALGMIMVYIMFRFTGKFALGAVAALIHDVIITIGAFAAFQWTFNLPELAALLAVIGYSLNDTIVVSDRIRENFRSTRRGTSAEIINYSLNQTLGRTLVTSLTTLLVLVALLVAGGEQIAGFARALTIGVVIGTYSSIYVAATVLLTLQLSRQDLAVPEKES